MKADSLVYPVFLSSVLLSVLPSIANPVPETLEISSVSARSLDVQRLIGRVSYLNSWQSVRVGDRLTRAGQGIATGSRSSLILGIDTGIGTVNVAENTNLTISELATTSNGGKVTRLNVSQGQVRINVRSFTNPQSLFEVKTPAGISGVRGTEFGVGVAFDGRTSVVTNEGSVAVSGAGESVDVGAGFASIVVEGQPPTEPMPFEDNLNLYLEPVRRDIDNNLSVTGRVDPLNLVWVNEEPVIVSLDGTFTLSLDKIPKELVAIRLLTPLGSTSTSFVLFRESKLPITLQGERDEF